MSGILYFGLGYFFARLIQKKVTADILLKWDEDIFGWRPVISGTDVLPGKRYLAAFELDTNDKIVEIVDT